MNPDEQDQEARPAWQSEFPIQQAEEFRVSRRGFAVMCGGAAAAGIAGLTLAAVLPRAEETASFVACSADALPPGTGKIVTSPDSGDSILLIRLPSGELRAYSQQCTHLLCPVHYDAEHNNVFCPCHHGVFDSETGAAVAGPPRKALPRFRVEIREGLIYVGSGKIRGEA